MRQKAVSSAPQNDEPNQMLVIRATIPMLRSVTAPGHAGKVLASVVPEIEIPVTVATPARMPAIAPADVGNDGARRFSTRAGKSWVAKL